MRVANCRSCGIPNKKIGKELAGFLDGSATQLADDVVTSHPTYRRFGKIERKRARNLDRGVKAGGAILAFIKTGDLYRLRRQRVVEVVKLREGCQ